MSPSVSAQIEHIHQSNKPKFVYEDDSLSEISMVPEKGSSSELKKQSSIQPNLATHQEEAEEHNEVTQSRSFPAGSTKQTSPTSTKPPTKTKEAAHNTPFLPAKQASPAQLAPLQVADYDIENGILPTPPPPPQVPGPPPTPPGGGPAPIAGFSSFSRPSSGVSAQNVTNHSQDLITSPRGSLKKKKTGNPLIDDTTTEEEDNNERSAETRSLVRFGSMPNLMSPRSTSLTTSTSGNNISNNGRYAGFAVQAEERKDGLNIVDLAAVPTRARKSLSDIFGADLVEAKNEPLALPHLPEETKTFLTRGQILIKHSKKAPPRPRYIFMDQKCEAIFRQDPEKSKISERAAKKASMKVSEITQVDRGNCSKPLLRKDRHGKYLANHETCFSVRSTSRTIDLECGCVSDCEKWVAAFNTIIKWQDTHRTYLQGGRPITKGKK